MTRDARSIVTGLVVSAAAFAIMQPGQSETSSSDQDPPPVVASAAASAAEPQINWLTDLRKAYELSSRDGKPILVHFTAAWCEPCRDLEQYAFEQPSCIERMNAFHCVSWDISKLKVPLSWGIREIPVDVLIVFSDGKPKTIGREEKAPSNLQGYLARLTRFQQLAKSTERKQ
ncbi:MAG: thioredoxin family protein [Pseudomonadota bacterium]